MDIKNLVLYFYSFFMSSKISLMSFLAIASLLLISCGESEQYKQ